VDSSVVDCVICSQGKGSPVDGALISQIRQMLALDWEVVVKYSIRTVKLINLRMC
jgi:hypothetical protein